MRIVCTGGREYSDWNMVQDVLGALKPTEVYVGDSTGADELVLDWCKSSNTKHEKFEAKWTEYGNSAGPIRNREMLAKAGNNALVIAFPGNKGTRNCIKTAIGLNMIVLKVER